MKKHKHDNQDEKVEVNETESNEATSETVDIDPIKIALARIETLENALKDAENDKYRALAEAQNMKKRVLADFELKSKYMFKSAALELITVYENLLRANEQAPDYDSLKKGLELALAGFNQVLSKEGVTKIEALHQPFNPELHQSLVVEESDEFEPDTIIEVYQDGYLLKDRLLRASMVKVSKEKEEN
jgi:molecular chaperone GrpE